jgi:hypothetical protein
MMEVWGNFAGHQYRHIIIIFMIESRNSESRYDLEIILIDIPQYKSWKVIEKINYGWSEDIKFFIEDLRGTKYLLRISNIDKLMDKTKEFSIIQKYNQLNFEMSQAIDMGICNNGQSVYMLLSWVDGDSMENVIMTLTEQEQYRLGMKAVPQLLISYVTGGFQEIDIDNNGEMELISYGGLPTNFFLLINKGGKLMKTDYLYYGDTPIRYNPDKNEFYIKDESGKEIELEYIKESGILLEK